jgi:DNA repair photolyase
MLGFQQRGWVMSINKLMEITTVIGCKNMCSYCPQRTLINSYNGERIMTFDTFKQCIDKIPVEVKSLNEMEEIIKRRKRQKNKRDNWQVKHQLM